MMQSSALNELPKAKAAFEAGQTWVGLLAVEQIEAQMANATIPEQAQEKLKACLEVVQNTVEIICPPITMATSTGIYNATGPVGVGCRETMIMVVTEEAQAVMVVESELEYDDRRPEEATPGAIWGAMINFVNEQDPKLVPTLIGWRLGKDGVAEMNKMAQNVRINGLTPCIVAIAVRHENRTMGIVSMIGLPPTVEAQIALQMPAQGNA